MRTAATIIITLVIQHASCAPAGAQPVFDTLTPRLLRAIECTTQPASPVQPWTHLAGDATRALTARVPGLLPPSTFEPLWTTDTDDQGRPIDWIGPAGVVALGPSVFGVALIDFTDHAVAVDRRTGAVRWTAPIPFALLDSWSSPAADPGNNTVLYAAERSLTALDASTGELRWQADLAAPIVNASPAITTDLHPRDRAFITDYAQSGPGQLICVNVDRFHPTLNPHHPGDIVWTAPLPGPTSGNTPAVRDGIVYVATSAGPVSAPGSDRPDAGRVAAYDARASSSPAPLWTATNPDDSGFFGGLAATADTVIASSYAFTPGQFAATTIALDRFTGDPIWQTGTNRTNAIPTPLPGGRVLIAGGLPDDPFFPPFGTVPSLQLIDPNTLNPTSSLVIWDSAQATLTDANNNGEIDPGEDFLPLGGWTVQPVRIQAAGRDLLLVATIADSFAGSFFDPPARLHLIDPALHPADPGFIIATIEDAGAAPAVVNGVVYTTGTPGLRAIRLTP